MEKLNEMLKDISYDINGIFDDSIVDNTQLYFDIKELIFDESKLQADARKDILISVIQEYIYKFSQK